MKNQVIEVLNAEHGAKVIEYWKSKGVDTGDYTGQCSLAIGHNYRYYGVINDKFNNYNIQGVNNYNAEIITLLEFPRVMLTWSRDKNYAEVRNVIAYFPEFLHPYLVKDSSGSPSWFKHAIEVPENVLPVIQGYKGKFTDTNVIEYGCIQINTKDIITLSNLMKRYDMSYLHIKGVKASINDINEIVKIIKNK